MCAAPITADGWTDTTNMKWLAPLVIIFMSLSLTSSLSVISFGLWDFLSERLKSISFHPPIAPDWLAHFLNCYSKMYIYLPLSPGFVRSLAAGKTRNWKKSFNWLLWNVVDGNFLYWYVTSLYGFSTGRLRISSCILISLSSLVVF